MLTGRLTEFGPMESQKAASKTRRPDAATGDGLQRGRALLLEPDELTRWSITTYLCRWFVVESVDSCEDAASRVSSDAFDALVLSDKLTEDQVRDIQRLAANRNPAVRTVRTVTATSESLLEQTAAVQLEKPFDLALLARLLGVREVEPV